MHELNSRIICSKALSQIGILNHLLLISCKCITVKKNIHFIVLPRLCVGKIRHVIHSFCLLPWQSSLSAHNFQGAFSRAIKLARPLAKVVFYCSVVFWKKRTEQKATNIPKHEREWTEIFLYSNLLVAISDGYWTRPKTYY